MNDAHARTQRQRPAHEGGLHGGFSEQEATMTNEAAPPGFELTAGPADLPKGGGTSPQGGPGKKDPEVSAHLYDETPFTGSAVVPGMKLLGFQRATSVHSIVQERLLMAGSKEQWATILQYMDNDALFSKYLYCFLTACTDPAGLQSPNGSYKTTVHRLPTREEELELMHALYGQGAENGDIDFVDDIFEDGLVTGAGLDWTSPLLAAFVARNQHRFLEAVSDSNALLDDGDISTFATEATRNTGNPVVVCAMIDHAFASAVAATKQVFAGAMQSNEEFQIMEQVKVSTLVHNAALVIKGALDAYGDKVSAFKDGAGKAFDETWNLIPIPSLTGLDLIVDGIKAGLKEKFLEKTVKLRSSGSMRQGLLEAYNDLLVYLAGEAARVDNPQLDKKYVVQAVGLMRTSFDLIRS